MGEQGLEALIFSLKNIYGDIEDIYHAVIKNDIYKDLPDSESADKFFDLNDDMSDVRNNAMDSIRKLQKK